MDNSPVKLIQMSDLHLFKSEASVFVGVNTALSFASVLDMYKKRSNNADLIILNGDLAQDASKEAYERIAEQLYHIEAPIYYVPGNHDDPDKMRTVYPLKNIFNQRSVIVRQWQIILLNSCKSRAVAGYLAEDQFEFLHESLEMYPEHHAVVVFHHHPILVGSAWLDPLGLTNANALWDFLQGYPQIRAVLFGHVHQECNGKKNGIRYYSPPSTCFQFKPHSLDFALDHIPPGYRWLDLYPNGEIKTGIHRLSHYVGEFQANAEGY